MMPHTESPSDGMNQCLDRAYASFRILFGEGPYVGGTLFDAVCAFLETVSRELADADSFRARMWRPSWDGPDSVDRLNFISGCSGAAFFASKMDRLILDALSRRNLPPEKEEFAFFLAHARQFAEAFSELIPRYTELLLAGEGPDPDACPRLAPDAGTLSLRSSALLRMKDAAIAMELARGRNASDPFASGRIFRHRRGEFIPVTLPAIREVKDFYGYHAARRTFLEHFRIFAEGHGNLPLLISSLPGLGKTQMTISHSLHYPEITLILAEPDDIARGLEELILALSAHPKRKFMVFFDDIDATRTDWYYFRANVGGTFSLPLNIAITISSNQRFPANISSRGRGFVFPMFDEIRCQEMILDFLVSQGMREPSTDLVSVMASDYVADFGQKLFEELSPRTLVRYLSGYARDGRKRKAMLEASKQELIARPDALVFYDENVKIMRSIYGEDAVRELTMRNFNETDLSGL